MEAQNAIYLDEETGGKGRQFKSRFLVPGLVKYDYGVCLLTKENADKFIQGFVGCPVVINHQEVTDDNAKAVSVGNIFSVWFDEKDGYYWCNGIINDKQAIELINKGYSVSCQYTITEYSDNDSNALHNGNPYDKIIENGKPEHLAIVNNPRYEGAKIAVNAIMAQNEDKWITIHPNGEENKGRHLLLKDGESVEDAMHRNGWYKKRQAKEDNKEEDFEKETKTTKKDENRHQKVRDLEDKAYKEFKKTYDNYINGAVKISDFGKAKEQFNKKYKDAFDKLESDRFVSFEDFTKRENKQSDTKEEKKERTFIDKKTGKEQSLKDLVEKGLTPVRYGSSLWDNKPSYGIGDGKIEYKITEEEYKQALEHQKDKKSSDLQKAKEQSKDLTDYVKWQYDADIEPHITRRVGDKTLVEWDELPRVTKSALKRLDFDDKVKLEQYSASEMSIEVKDKKIFENLEKHRQNISEQKQTASNSFVSQFKDTLYTALAEGIANRLGELIASNEDKWITIHPHGEESDDYRRLLIKDGETVEDAMHRQGYYNKRQAKDEKALKEEKKEDKKEVISESKEYTLQKDRIRTLVKQGFDKKQYYEKLDAETGKLWKAYTKAVRETTIYWDDSDDVQKIKKEKLESIHEEYVKKRDERSKAVQELNAITRETKAQQIEIINSIKENIDIEKSLKSYNSSDIDKKIKKVIDEYDINKIDLEYKEINKKLEDEKNKWLKYFNSASSVEEQNKRVLEYDKWYKDSDIKKKKDELFDKIVNFSEYRNKAISEALQLENGGDFRLTTVKGSKLTQKINKTNQLLSGIIDKNYIPDFSPFANGQVGRANASGNIINITSKEPVEIYIHESMHWLERVNPKMLANSLAFLEYRTKGEEAQSLKKLTKVDYRANEYAKPDKFFNAYCGKIYDNATEIMSMGIQRLFEHPKKFMEEDKEYFDFVIANLQGKI